VADVPCAELRFVPSPAIVDHLLCEP
jgi:hypothetical protein